MIFLMLRVMLINPNDNYNDSGHNDNTDGNNISNNNYKDNDNGNWNDVNNYENDVSHDDDDDQTVKAWITLHICMERF